jgi:hypothetical protein
MPGDDPCTKAEQRVVLTIGGRWKLHRIGTWKIMPGEKRHLWTGKYC